MSHLRGNHSPGYNDTRLCDVETEIASPVDADLRAAHSGPEDNYGARITTSPKASRLLGLDVAKGALVLVMVLYHWMNYFIGLDSGLYKYLRFLTPSFIFVTGFLISHVYLSRFTAGETHISGRLIRRGLKLLAIVLFLNAAAEIAGKHAVGARLGGGSLTSLAWAYLMGFAPVAFSVLVPIGYLLILSAGLLIVSRRFPGVFHLVSAALMITALVCEWIEFQNGYLDMLSVGMLGVSTGHVRIEALNRLLQRRATILITYAAYVAAIAKWNAVYGLQVAGVCVNLAILYWFGAGRLTPPVLKRVLIRLGEYSLFAYIVQIVVLQILCRSAHVFGAGIPSVYVALLVCAACTVLSVEAMDHAKRRMPALNRMYIAVFA